MRLKDLTKETLENMSYDEIAYIILEENGKKMKLLDIFKKVAKVLNLPEAEIENRIADFFELLSTNKKFIMLDKGYWDLSNKHIQKVIIEDEDDVLADTVSEDEEDSEQTEDDIYFDSEEDDVNDDDLSDLVIIDPEDEETSL